jgi:hypothetical protein
VFHAVHGCPQVTLSPAKWRQFRTWNLIFRVIFMVGYSPFHVKISRVVIY